MADRVDIMLAYPYEEKRLKRYSKPYYMQPKLNGDRCRAIIGFKGPIILYSSSAIIKVSVPHINEALNVFRPLAPIELDGELYCHGMPFDSIRSITSRTVSLHPDHKSIQYWIYDVVDESATQKTRLPILETSLFKSKHLVKVPTVQTYTLQGIMEFYTYCLAQGYEGTIIRNLDSPYVRKKTTQVMKMKPQIAGEYKITGYEEEMTIHKEPKGTLGALWLVTPEGEPFKVGTGFKRWQREELWKNKDQLAGNTAKIRFSEFSEKKTIPTKLVFEKIIWE